MWLVGTPVAVPCLSFFFQAEDGIRDLTVTGVQTCALPIFEEAGSEGAVATSSGRTAVVNDGTGGYGSFASSFFNSASIMMYGNAPTTMEPEIGRASCRERV